MNARQRRKIKRSEMNITEAHMQAYYNNYKACLDKENYKVPSFVNFPVIKGWSEALPKEEKPMQYINACASNTTADPEASKRDHLLNRLRTVYVRADRELEKKFGLRGEDRPETLGEVIDAIKSDKFEIADGYDRETTSSYYIMDYLKWKDPSIKKDKEGYKAAEKLLKAAYTKASDDIIVLSPDKGLEILRAFETENLVAN